MFLIKLEKRSPKRGNSFVIKLENNRKKQIDLAHDHKGIMSHTHVGYDHDEDGTKHLSTEEKAMVDFVRKIWQDKNNK